MLFVDIYLVKFLFGVIKFLINISIFFFNCFFKWFEYKMKGKIKVKC